MTGLVFTARFKLDTSGILDHLGLDVIGHGGIDITFGFFDDAAVVVGEGEIRIEPNGLVIVGEVALKVAAVNKISAVIEVG